MKTAFTLLAVFSCLLTSSALAGGVKTLVGFNDSVTLKDGQVAYVIGVSDNVIVQFEKSQQWPPRPEQFRLGLDQSHRHCEFFVDANSAPRPQFVPTVHNPFVLGGKGKLVLKTDGVVTVKIVDANHGK